MAITQESGKEISYLDQIMLRRQKQNSARGPFHEAVLQVEDDGTGKYTLVFITPKGNRVTVVAATV
jgi:hypothetical protein